MQQVDGRKGYRAYPWRSARKAMEMNFEIATQCSDALAEPAEVSRGHSTRLKGGRAEHQEVPEAGRIREKCRESRQLHQKVEAGRWKEGWNPGRKRER